MIPPPIFIVGAPRSGTTLLRRILNRHPRIAICGETHFGPLVYQKPRRKAFGDLANPANRRRLVAQYTALQRTNRLGMDCGKLTDRLLQQATSYRAMFACVLQFYAESRAKARCGEKTPQHAYFVETLCDWFPDAAILHLVRDPRDVATSLRRMPYGFRSVILNARTWLNCNRAAGKASQHPGYLQVRYESLVVDPAQELRRICDFVGEEFYPSMLTPERQAVLDPLGRDRSLNAVTTARMGKWREELSAQQIAQVEWMAAPELENLGYRPEVPAASAVTVLRGVSAAVYELARHTFRRLPAFWYYYAAPTRLRQQEYWRHPENAQRRASAAAQPKSSDHAPEMLN